MLNQNQIKNLYFATVTAAEAAGRPKEKCYVEETGQHYAYVADSGQTIDHIKTLSTANGGDTRWIAINDYASAGVYTSPSVTDNYDGTITIGNGGVYHLHDTVDGSGFIRSYTIDGGTFDASNAVPHYIVVNYNGGTPVMQCIEDYSTINGTTIIPILIIFYNTAVSPNSFDIIDWGEQAKAVATNTKLRFLFAQNINGVEDGVMRLSVFDNKKIKITGGNRWYGLSRINYDEFETGVGDSVLREWVKDGSGNWSPTIVSEYDNQNYQGASGKTALVNNYGVLWVYRKLSTTDPLGIVAGYIFGTDDYNKLSDAQATTPPTYAEIPSIFVSFGIFVGRIIVDKRTNTPVQVDSAFSYSFGSPIPDHNDTLHKQGGDEILDEFYHLSLTQYNNLGTGEHNSLSGLQGGSVSPEEYYHLTSEQHTNATSPATNSSLGLVQIGSGLSVTEEGVVSVPLGGGLGLSESEIVVLIGNGIDINGEGRIVVDETELNHNIIGNLQGGSDSPSEYYHLTQAEHTVVQNTSGSNTGDQSSSDFTHNDLFGLEGGGGSPEGYYHLDKTDYDALTDANAQLEELHSDGSPTFDTVTATLADIGTVHAVYSDSTTQTLTSATVPWVMLFDTNEISNTHITHGKTGQVTISIASPAVVDWAGHGLNVDSEVVFTTDGALPTGLTAGTRYYVISAGFGANSFQVSATPQGAAIETSGTQSGTHTATNISIFTIGTAGTYGFIFSTLCDCTSGNGTTIDIWFRKNGVDVDRSNTRVQMATASNVVISIADILLDLVVGDEVEMFWVGSSTNDRLLSIAAQVSPTRPATPSTILTVKKVSK